MRLLVCPHTQRDVALPKLPAAATPGGAGKGPTGRGGMQHGSRGNTAAALRLFTLSKAKWAGLGEAQRPSHGSGI